MRSTADPQAEADPKRFYDARYSTGQYMSGFADLFEACREIHVRRELEPLGARPRRFLTTGAFVVDARILGQNAVSQVVPLLLPDASSGDPGKAPLLTTEGGPVAARPRQEVRGGLRALVQRGVLTGADGRGCVGPGGRLTIRIDRVGPLTVHLLRLSTTPAPSDIALTVTTDAGVPSQEVGGSLLPGTFTTPSRLPPAGASGLGPVAYVDEVTTGSALDRVETLAGDDHVAAAAPVDASFEAH